LPVLALALLGARRIRVVAELAMLAGPALAAGATAVLGSLLPRRPTPPGPELPVATFRADLRRGPIVAAALALLLLAVVPRISAGPPFIDLGLEEDLVPFAAIAFVEQHGLAERLYNDLEVGSYLTWRWWPRRRVFQDPRINGYPESFHAVLRRPDLDRATWQAFLEGHGVTAALITYPDMNPRAALFDPRRWALVYCAPDALVFARRRPEWRALIAARELPVTFRHARQSGTVPEPIEVRPTETPLSGCQWQRRLGDHLVEVGDDEGASRAYERALGDRDCLDPAAGIELRRTLGGLALRLDDPTAALAHLQGLDDTESRTNRAFALLRLQRPPEALSDFESVLGTTPAHAEALFGRALALEALGRRPEAEAALRAFLARHPRHLAAPAATERLARLAGTR
jgi:tetratricopeptide (TPR) repeat protein